MQKKTDSCFGIVSIVGRPNVGKSALFNALIRQRKAIVAPEYGVTRDRIIDHFIERDKPITLIDTGGIRFGKCATIEEAVRRQAMLSIDMSELILFVVDAQTGLTPDDMVVAQLVREKARNVFLVVNKVDNDTIKHEAANCCELGFDKAYFVSALHKNGIADLRENIAQSVTAGDDDTALGNRIKVSIIGRPNVGKSSLVNTLTQTERCIVAAEPGTTRDAIEIKHSENDKHLLLIDTAGFRKKSHIKEPVDYYSLVRAQESIKKSDIVLMMINGPEGMVSQDKSLIDLVFKEGKGCIIVVNKWDLMSQVKPQEYRKTMFDLHHVCAHVPILFVSALTGLNLKKVIETIFYVHNGFMQRVPTPVLNNFIRDIAQKRTPEIKKGKRFKGYYIVQGGKRPPTFVLFGNDPSLLSKNYRDYITNQMYHHFGFEGIPLRLKVKGRDGSK